MASWTIDRGVTKSPSEIGFRSGIRKGLLTIRGWLKEYTATFEEAEKHCQSKNDVERLEYMRAVVSDLWEKLNAEEAMYWPSCKRCGRLIIVVDTRGRNKLFCSTRCRTQWHKERGGTGPSTPPKTWREPEPTQR